MPPQSKDLLAFGVFRIDVEQRVLLSRGTPVPLPPKVFDTLLALAEAPGRVLEKDHLLKAIWPETFVEEGSLTRNVSTLRKILGHSPDGTDYIETIPKRGYRFKGPVRRVPATLVEEGPPTTDTLPYYRTEPEAPPPPPVASLFRRPLVFGGIGVVLMLAVALGVVAWRTTSAGIRDAAPQVRSFAVLPLRPLAQDQGDNYIGLGIADTIISAVSRVSTLSVRPTSAVRRYAAANSDTLFAARELGVDAVLEGNWFRAGDRLRVSVNVIRTRDSRSLWTETLDIRAGDLVAIQDQLAGPIVSSLRAALTPVPDSFRPRGTANPAAYELYMKGRFYFGDRGFTAQTRRNSDAATMLFEQAVAADPKFAEAYAMLGFAYAWTAIFIEENPSLIERAEAVTTLAEHLDDRLGQVHLNRGFMLYSWYRGWRVAEAIRENKRALALDPALSDNELGALFYHVGLYDQWESRNLSSIAINPANQLLKTTFISEFFLIQRPDDGLAMQRRLLGRDQTPDARYFLGKRMAREAATGIEAAAAQTPTNPVALVMLMKLRAAQGRHLDAQALVPSVLAVLQRNRSYHHYTYDIAQAYAQAGRMPEAMHWLNETVDNGFPNYPLLASDEWLNPIRRTPEFTKLLARMRNEFEAFRAQVN